MTGRSYVRYNDRLIMLQEWIDGKTYTDNKLSNHLLPEAAALPGKLHDILRDYYLPPGMDSEWLKEFSPDKSAV